MKKSTKKIILTMLIVFTMSVSVFAYALMSMTRDQNNRQNMITSFIVDGNVSNEVKQRYIQQGITFLTLYYNENTSDDLVSLVEDLPARFTTSFGEYQIIIIKVYDNETNQTYAVLESINGKEMVNVTKADDMIKPLCAILSYPSIECVSNISEGNI
ncbi:MAG: hypothetical protein J7J38_01285 [Candidatus Aenigmarchaeota archaeon]|nr:hypothetical protein [Candidatus Aenigmarchaeota archaeon]